jgi:hypothetical protein
MDPAYHNEMMTAFAEATAAVYRNGLDYARLDNPEAFRQALKWMASPGATVQIRIDIGGPGQGLKTTALVVDANGEPLIQIFGIVAKAAGNA